MNLEYSIIANSKEQFEMIENALNKFDENYKVTRSFGRLNAKSLIDNMIQIFPDKDAKITEVLMSNNELQGYLLKSTPDFYLILLGDNRYSVEYTNPDFRKEKK